MARRPSLAEPDLRQAPPPSAPVRKRQESARTPARQGKRGIALWVTPEAFKQLRGIAFEEERSMQSLMEEAIDLLFEAREKPRLAREEPRS
jgi:hypothetical protein